MPHDNNIAQRNVAPIAGFRTESLVKSLSEKAFWIKHPEEAKRPVVVLIDVKLRLDLKKLGWDIGLKGVKRPRFKLAPGQQVKVLLVATPGDPITPKLINEQRRPPRIDVNVEMDGVAVGGMTFPIDPKERAGAGGQPSPVRIASSRRPRDRDNRGRRRVFPPDRPLEELPSRGCLLSANRGDGRFVLLAGAESIGKRGGSAWRSRRARGSRCCTTLWGCCRGRALKPTLRSSRRSNDTGERDLDALRSDLGPLAVELGQLFPQLSVGVVLAGGRGDEQAAWPFEVVVALLEVWAHDRGLRSFSTTCTGPMVRRASCSTT